MYRPMTAQQKKLDTLLQTYPKLRKDVPARMFYVWSLEGVHVKDERTGEVIVPFGLLTELMGLTRGNAQTGQFLQRMRDEYLPALRVRNYFHEGHRCRSIIASGFTEKEMCDWAALAEEKYVQTKTLRPWTKRQQEEAIRELRKDYARHTYANSEQKFVATMLHALPSSVFALAEENRNRAFQMAASRNDGGHAARILHNLATIPMEFYRPSEYGRSLRLFGIGAQYLPKDVRQAAYPDWKDIDINNAQAAILAGLCDLPQLSQLFQEKASIWPELLAHLGVAEQKAVAKPPVKIALYSTFYGKRPRDCEKSLATDLKKLSLTAEEKLYVHPYMVEIVEGLARLKAQIKKEGGMHTPYGWEYYYPGSDIDTFLACCIQAYEFWLIVPVYELAERNKERRNDQFQVVLHQHDGVSLLFDEKAHPETVKQEIAEAVWKRGQQMKMFVSID